MNELLSKDAHLMIMFSGEKRMVERKVPYHIQRAWLEGAERYGEGSMDDCPYMVGSVMWEFYKQGYNLNLPSKYY